MEWSFNPLVAIGIALAVMFFGYGFGLFEGRNQGYKNRKKEEAEEKKHQPVPIPPASPSLPSSDETPILSLGMGPGGQIRLKMDGEPANPDALDGEQRKRLIAILTLMRPMLEAPKTAVSHPPAPRPVSSSQGAPASSSPPPSAAKPAPASSMRPASTPSLQQQTAAPPASAEDDDEDEHAAPQSIVAQINSVLQARLVGTPLADKGIRLQESLDGGVLVWVGLQKFEGVDDVPDETIKAALKGAIAEWENKYTPGL